MEHKVDYKLISLIIILIAVVSFFGWKFFFQPTNLVKKISPQQASAKLAAYLNQKVLQGKGKIQVSKVEENKSGFYEIDFSMKGRAYKGYLSLDGRFLFPQSIDLSKSNRKEKTVEGSFKEVESQKICQENGKPIVYFFGSSTCPHCRWEKPVIEKVTSKFGDYISFHEKIDDFGKDRKIFENYSDGGVPVVVLGCKYYRLGSGEKDGKQKEEQALTNLICQLTKGNPGSVCHQSNKPANTKNN